MIGTSRQFKSGQRSRSDLISAMRLTRVFRKQHLRALSLSLVTANILAAGALANDSLPLPIQKITVDKADQVVIHFGTHNGSFPSPPHVLDLPGPNHRIVMDFADSCVDKVNMPSVDDLSTRLHKMLPVIKGVRYTNIANTAKPTARVVIEVPEQVAVKPRVVKLEEDSVTISLGDHLRDIELPETKPAEPLGTTILKDPKKTSSEAEGKAKSEEVSQSPDSGLEMADAAAAPASGAPQVVPAIERQDRSASAGTTTNAGWDWTSASQSAAEPSARKAPRIPNKAAAPAQDEAPAASDSVQPAAASAGSSVTKPTEEATAAPAETTPPLAEKVAAPAEKTTTAESPVSEKADEKPVPTKTAAADSAPTQGPESAPTPGAESAAAGNQAVAQAPAPAPASDNQAKTHGSAPIVETFEKLDSAATVVQPTTGTSVTPGAQEVLKRPEEDAPKRVTVAETDAKQFQDTLKSSPEPAKEPVEANAEQALQLKPAMPEASESPSSESVAAESSAAAGAPAKTESADADESTRSQSSAPAAVTAAPPPPSTAGGQEGITLYNSAYKAQLSGRISEAIANYKAAIAASPSLAEAHSNLGIIYNQQHNFAQALSEFRKALAIDPKDAITYNGIGAALRASKDRAGALKNFQTAVNLDPHLATAFYNLGTIYEEMKDSDKAMEAYKQAVKNDYRLGEAYYQMGKIMGKKKHNDEAIAYYKEALKVGAKADYSDDARQQIASLLGSDKTKTK